jgi:hypothetical protein
MSYSIEGSEKRLNGCEWDVSVVGSFVPCLNPPFSNHRVNLLYIRRDATSNILYILAVHGG